MITVFSAQALSKDRAEQDSLLISQEKPFDRGIGLPSSRFLKERSVAD